MELSKSLDDVDLNLLRVFDVLMQERSVTGAAAHLGRTQSAVSHSLAELRILFKDELFTRAGDGPVPKPLSITAVPIKPLFPVVTATSLLESIRCSLGEHVSLRPGCISRVWRSRRRSGNRIEAAHMIRPIS